MTLPCQREVPYNPPSSAIEDEPVGETLGERVAAAGRRLRPLTVELRGRTRLRDLWVQGRISSRGGCLVRVEGTRAETGVGMGVHGLGGKEVPLPGIPG